MNSAFYFIAILGCGEGEAPCEQVRMAETRFESREACLAASDSELLRLGAGLEFPIVVAECRAQGAAPARIMAAEVVLPDPDRRSSAWDD
ncbi:hypothetical protein [Allosphingosinicella sp.]|jgi:hypothetical protein|uniref:hypothetical protein n=1 Tax=Allosphingosinicella sp. TaxID=2823234 RepID=UPI002F064E1D